MANPNNITLRSVKGTQLTVEDLDLNMTELQNVITEYNTFSTTTYQNLQNDVVLLRNDYDGYVVTTDGRLNILETDVSGLQSDMTVSISRLDNLESTTLSAQQGFPVKDDGVWSGTSSYDINSVVVHEGISYISSVANNTSTPGASGSWVSLIATSTAEQVAYNDPSGNLLSTNINDAIDELVVDIGDKVELSVYDTKMTTLDSQISTLDNETTTLNTKIDTEILDVRGYISTEISSLDSSLRTKINTDINTLDTKVNNIESTLTTSINNVNTTLGSRLTTAESDIDTLMNAPSGDLWTLTSKTSQYTFDAQERITQLVETVDDANDIRTTNYTYSGSNISEITTEFRGLIRTETFTYDANGIIESSSAVITTAP